MGAYDIRAHGARGDGAADDAAAIQRAIDACAAAGGGRVVVPAGGAFLTGAIRLRSHVELHLEPGSRLLSADRREDFPDRVVIGARDAEDVAITGTGTIDGRGRRFMVGELPHIYRGVDWRPWLILFENCRKVRFRDFTILDAAHWALTPVGCRDVVIHGLTILNDLKLPNGDGIDPENCRDVRISDCHIQAADDCICLKSSSQYRHYGPCENIAVTNCTIVSTSCGIKVGSGVWTQVRDCVVANCVIKASNRGLGIQHRDAGTVENLLFTDCVIETRLFHSDWWGKAEPIYVTALPREPGQPVGPVRNIRFRNILCRGENGVFVRGCPGSRPRGLLFENVRVEIAKTTRHPGGQYDGRPGVVDLYPHPTAGFHLREADDVALRHCEVAWAPGMPDAYGPALECRGVGGLRVEDFRGESAHPDRVPARVVDEG